MANSWGKGGQVSCPAKDLELFNLYFFERDIARS